VPGDSRRSRRRAAGSAGGAAARSASDPPPATRHGTANRGAILHGRTLAVGGAPSSQARSVGANAPVRPESSEAPANLCSMQTVNQTKLALWMVCVARAGYLDGARLVEFIDDWRDCVQAHDGPVGVDSYAQWTRRYSYRTAFNRLRLFRETFPQLGADGTPEGLMGPLLDRLAREVEVEGR